MIPLYFYSGRTAGLKIISAGAALRAAPEIGGYGGNVLYAEK